MVTKTMGFTLQKKGQNLTFFSMLWKLLFSELF